MSYEKTSWTNGVTPVNQSNMNKIENELETLNDKVDTLNNVSISNNNYGTADITTGAIDASNSPTASITITTHGRPVFMTIDGDLNPTSAGGWMYYYLRVDGNNVRYQCCQSTGSSVNNPFGASYLATNLAAGQHTFSCQFVYGNGTMTTTEAAGVQQIPKLIVFEI